MAAKRRYLVLPNSVRPFPQVTQTGTVGRRRNTGRTQIVTATPERRDDDEAVGGAQQTVVPQASSQVRRRLHQETEVVVQSSAPSPKRKRGRPRKNNQSSSEAADQAPKPKRVRRQQGINYDNDKAPTPAPDQVTTRSGRAVKPTRRSQLLSSLLKSLLFLKVFLFFLTIIGFFYFFLRLFTQKLSFFRLCIVFIFFLHRRTYLSK